jgi:hypothetical protein
VTFSNVQADTYDKLYVLRANSKLAGITDKWLPFFPFLSFLSTFLSVNKRKDPNS